jgi:hypothetical protein
MQASLRSFALLGLLFAAAPPSSGTILIARGVQRRVRRSAEIVEPVHPVLVGR